MKNFARNLIVTIVILFFGGFALFDFDRGRGHAGLQDIILGSLICTVVLSIARAAARPSA